MSKPKLTYFDFDGGRGEPARLALSIAGIEFEDDRIPFSEWPRRKGETPLGAVPVLEIGDLILTQSNAINRYVGKLSNLFPSDPWQQALCDEAMDVVEDIGARIVSTFDLPDEEKKERREALVDEPIPRCLSWLGKRLDESGGQYFADGKLTVADLKVFVWIRHLRSGALDHIPTDLPDRIAPNLVHHCMQVADHPTIMAYYARQR